MIIKIKDVKNGSYSTITKELQFKVTQITTIGIDTVILSIDKKSALEIMATLLDSVNMLNKDTENLIYEVEERLEANE